MTQTHDTAHYDVIIVGARVAGAATALLLSRRGLSVLVVERSSYGQDTLSTHALMRAGVLQLSRWGVLPAIVESGTPPIRKTTFHYGEDAVEVKIRARQGVDALYAPRRTVLDTALADAARAAGAEIRYRTKLRDLVFDGTGRVAGAFLEGRDGRVSSVRAGLVIGADGLRSRVATLVGAPVERTGRHATGVVYGYWEGLPADGYAWHYATRASAGVIPTGGGLTCLFASVSRERFRSETGRDVAVAYLQWLSEAAPALSPRSQSGALQVGALRSFPGTPGFFRRACGPGWALVGDAGYFKDPLTAHGITDALRDAELLANAIAGGGGADAALERYREERDELSVRFFDGSDAVASFEWDFERLRALHLGLNEEMRRETERLTALDDPPPPSRAGGDPRAYPVFTRSEAAALSAKV